MSTAKAKTKAKPKPAIDYSLTGPGFHDPDDDCPRSPHGGPWCVRCHSLDVGYVDRRDGHRVVGADLMCRACGKRVMIT